MSEPAMSLQARVISLIVAVFVVYGALDYAVQRLFILPSFQALEREQVRKDMDRVVQALDRETQHLAVSATDWATWDDTYWFVQNHNAAYREANLNLEALKSLKVNFLGIFDSAGQKIWGQLYDFKINQEMVLPELSGDRWPADHPLVWLPHVDSEARGLLVTAAGPLLMAAKPVLTSNREGPVRGSVVLGSFLDSAAIATQTQVNLTISILDDALLESAEVAAAVRELGNTGGIVIREGVDTDQVYRVLPDLFGKPAVLLRIDAPKAISAQGETAIRFALLSLLGMGLIILAGLVIGLRRIVLTPIQQLTRAVVGFGQSGHLAVGLTLKRRDEIGALVDGFNAMLAQIQQRDADLAGYNARLENEVATRTLDLSVANTELRVAVGELQLAKERAEAASRAKSQFLANVSHEIRTPMNGILGMAELLLDTELPAKPHRFAEMIQHSGISLLTIINDVLDFSKIEAGKLELETVDFDLRHLVEEAVALFAESAQRKGLEMICALPAEPVLVRGDPGRLRQVLGNLLSNAIKFTERGQVVARATVVEGDAAGYTLRLAVSDSGIGIPPEVQERVFDAFDQADGSMTRRYGGTGLGLTIARQLVELMGGTIGVESVVGQGSTFAFTLWLARAVGQMERLENQPAVRGLAASESSRPALARQDARVLLVEDNSVNQEVARVMLSQIGCTVTVANDGREALDWLAGNACDLVFMDCQMPVMDGFEATARIREREQGTATNRLPVVALTAHAVSGDRERCLAAGMDDYLSKPFTQADLIAVLNRWLPGDTTIRFDHHIEPPRRSAPPLLIQGGENAETAIDQAVLDKIRILERNGAPGLVARLVGLYLRDAPRLIEQMHQAVASNDDPALGVAAHSLKSSSANVGALRLHGWCKTLEAQAHRRQVADAAAQVAAIESEFKAVQAILNAELTGEAD